MAAGDVFSGMQSVAAGASLDVKPGPTSEAIIHNLYWDGPVSVMFTNGASDITFDSDGSAGGRLGMTTHVTNTIWVKVTNDDTVSRSIGYDGIFTK